MSLSTASKPQEPAAIVKVSFFLKSSSSSSSHNTNGNNNNNNTQVWISLPLLAATSARSLVVAAFRSAADRFGGAQLEDHPNRLLPFLYTHGEFLYLDARETPLLQIPEVHELVFNEGKQVLTVALTTEDEYHRLNPQRPLSSLQAETRRDTTTSNDASSYHNGKKTSPTTVTVAPAPNQQNTSFRGRVRAGSILPEAFAFDPIQDPRGRPHESSRSAAASSSSSASPRVVVKRDNLTDSFSSMRSVDGEDIFPLPPSASSSAPSASPRAAHEEEGSSPSASPHRPEVGSATLLFVTGRGVEHTVSLTYKRETTCSALVTHALFEFQKKFLRPEGDEDQKEFHQFLQLPEHYVALHYQKKSGGYRRFLFTDAIPVSRGLRPAPPTLQLVVLDPSEVPRVAAPRSRFADLITSGALPPLLQPDRSPMSPSSQRSLSRREPSIPSDSASSALRTVTTAKPWNEGSAATERWVMEKRLIAAEQTYVLRGSTAEMARSRANEETEMRRQLHTAETNLRDALAVRDERRKKLESLLRERAALKQQVQMQQTTIEEGTAARQTIASIEVVASWVRTDVASSRHRHLELHKAIAELRAAHQ
jgi:hypothetical protein